MTRNGLRGFSFGVLLTTLIFTVNQFFISPDQTQTSAITNQDIQQFAAENDQLLLKKADYEALVKQAKQKQAANPPKKLNTYTLVIRGGMNSQDISSLLAKYNIVRNAADFQAYLDENNYSRSIQVGTVTVTNEMSYEQMAKTITQAK